VVTSQEADILLTVGLYHLTSRAQSRSAFLADGSAQTALGVLTGAPVARPAHKVDCSIARMYVCSGCTCPALHWRGCVYITPSQVLSEAGCRTPLRADPAGLNVSLYFEQIRGEVRNVSITAPRFHHSTQLLWRCIHNRLIAHDDVKLFRCCLLQIQVEGIPFGNAAPLSTRERVCDTYVYTIDQVMQPTTSLAQTPGFSEISECKTAVWQRERMFACCKCMRVLQVDGRPHAFHTRLPAQLTWAPS